MINKKIKEEAFQKLEDIVPVPSPYQAQIVTNKKNHCFKFKIATAIALMTISFSTILVLCLNANLISGKQKGLSDDSRQINDNSSNSGDMMYPVSKWDDKEVPERYPSLKFGEIEYRAIGFQQIIDTNLVGSFLDNSNINGYDEIDKNYHTGLASVFSIKGFDIESCVALKIDDDKHDERYFVYVNIRISHSDLNEYMAKLGLPGTVDINSGLITRKIYFPEQKDGPIVENYNNFDKAELFNLIFSNDSMEELNPPKPYADSDYEEIIVDESIKQYDNNGNLIRFETINIEYDFNGFKKGPYNLSIGIKINDANQILLFIFGDRLQIKLKNNVYLHIKNEIFNNL